MGGFGPYHRGVQKAKALFIPPIFNDLASRPPAPDVSILCQFCADICYYSDVNFLYTLRKEGKS